MTRAPHKALLVLGATSLMSIFLAAGQVKAEEFAPQRDAPLIAQHEVWAVLSGGSLKGTIEGWSRVSGWTVIWDNPVDYRIRASATFQGAFEHAVAGLVDAIHQANPELTVTLYRGNQVLHVEDAARLRN